jgi:hypothetical protein
MVRSVAVVHVRGTAWTVGNKSGEVECLVMASRLIKSDEEGNDAKSELKTGANIDSKSIHAVVDDLPGGAESEDEIVVTVNVDVELGIVIIIKSHEIPKTEIVEESVNDRRVDIVEAVEISGACGIVKAANKVHAGEIEEHSEVLDAGVLVILAGGSSPILDGGGLAEIAEDEALDVVDKVVDFDEAEVENVVADLDVAVVEDTLDEQVGEVRIERDEIEDEEVRADVVHDNLEVGPVVHVEAVSEEVAPGREDGSVDVADPRDDVLDVVALVNGLVGKEVSACDIVAELNPKVSCLDSSGSSCSCATCFKYEGSSKYCSC